jgi:putative redox protein
MAYQALVEWKEGLHFQAESGGQTVEMDGVHEGGEPSLGMSPMRMVLAALGGCTAMDVISLMKKMRQDVTSLSVEVNAEREPEHPKAYTSFELVYRLRGRNIDRASVERAVSLSEDKYCSVGGTLKKAAPITYRIEIEEESV